MTRPDVQAVLSGLKEFQRRTARYAFERMYSADDPARRFLVADEVGLGKTLVARGVISQMLDHLWDTTPRLDIVYVCSNQDIARQNIRRLGFGGAERSSASRITLLPLEHRGLDEQNVNFFSFTPSTSFDMKGATGWSKERALLAHMLMRCWDSPPDQRRMLKVLRVSKGLERFRDEFLAMKPEASRIDPTILAAFGAALDATDLRDRFDEVSEYFVGGRGQKPLPRHIEQTRNLIIGEMRELLARVSLDALQPDLIILDEFQRFKGLLDENTPAGELAHGLFNYSQDAAAHPTARVLLLSATPYKMFTLAEEPDEDHYSDFIDTSAFLLNDAEKLEELRSDLDSYRLGLYHLHEMEDLKELKQAKLRIESTLGSVMSRTERLAVGADPNAMMETVPVDGVRLEPKDLAGYLMLQKVAGVVGQSDTIEYWKSAPYPLNFMTGYRLRELVDAACDNPATARPLGEAVRGAPECLLSREHADGILGIDPGNPRLRWLQREVTDRGLTQIPWLPPTIPYYGLGGAFKTAAEAGATKYLLFSSWRVVPRSVASVLSHHVRRELVGSDWRDEAGRKRAGQLLRLSLRRVGGVEQVQGLRLFNLMYPCAALATAIDPAKLASEQRIAGKKPPVSSVRRAAEQTIRPLLKRAAELYSCAEGDPELWQWAAPIMLDLAADPDRVTAWLTDDDRALGHWFGDERSEKAAHAALEEVRAVIAGEKTLGPPPANTADVLALVALGSPAVCAYRALTGLGQDGVDPLELMDHSAEIAGAMRGVLNQPEVIAMVRLASLENNRAYWRQALAFTAQSCLQAVFDEYVAVLVDSLGLKSGDPSIAADVKTAIVEAVSLPHAVLQGQVLDTAEDGSLERASNVPFQCKFALPFGDNMTATDEKTRSKRLREAFNSPFWPFVLTSTSIGQEGLDFHWYCHAVVHWNLPSNPVDMEQREGRVHRYKGHAIRKNVAGRHGVEALAAAVENDGRLWDIAFEQAREACDGDCSEMLPWWTYPAVLDRSDYRIRRYLPHLPLSREIVRAEQLGRSLAAYRMVFGQARQEDLLRFLMDRLTDDELEQHSELLQVNLAPPE